MFGRTSRRQQHGRLFLATWWIAASTMVVAAAALHDDPNAGYDAAMKDAASEPVMMIEETASSVKSGPANGKQVYRVTHIQSGVFNSVYV